MHRLFKPKIIMHCEIYEIQGSKMYEQKSTEKMEEEMKVHCFKVLIF